MSQLNGPGDPDLKTGIQIAYIVGNLPPKFGHARPSVSHIIHYVRNGQTDRQTDGHSNTSLWAMA